MGVERIFVVTGANKGIGYGIVKNLAQRMTKAVVYLTARNESLGEAALSKLNQELGDKKQAEVRFHQLDITDRASGEKLAADLLAQHGGFDVLVNNAGFAFKNAATEPPEVQARVTIGVNYEGTKQITNILLPVMRDGGRIVNVCSQAGILSGRYSKENIAKIASPSATVADVDDFVNRYITACVENNRREKGFPETAYGVSKAAEIALTRIQSRELKSRNIVVNGCCPGYVDTDMTSHKGPLTIDEGADTPAYLATSTESEPNGEFIYLRKPIEWISDSSIFA